MGFEIENRPMPKKKTKPNPLYKFDKVMLAELELAFNASSHPKRYHEAAKIVSHHMSYLDKASNDFVSSCRRIVRQYDKKHRRQ